MDYQKAKEMKELGFPQRRHDHAKYYIDEQTVVYFEDIKNAFKAKGWEDNQREETIDWLERLVYVPELVDLVGIESYNLTLDAAAHHFTEGKKEEQALLIKRTEDAVKTMGDKLAGEGASPTGESE